MELTINRVTVPRVGRVSTLLPQVWVSNDDPHSLKDLVSHGVTPLALAGWAPERSPLIINEYLTNLGGHLVTR